MTAGTVTGLVIGWAYRLDVGSDKPLVIRRYKAKDVMLVPAREWRFCKQLEADIKAGRCPRVEGSDCTDAVQLG